MTASSADDNRRAQAHLYGEPLGDLIKRCSAVLSLTQVRVAELLGISAPMLSQLMNARRVKIGNPAAVKRLQLMYAAASRVAAGEQSLEDAVRQLEAARTSEAVVTHHTEADPAAVRAVFRAAAPPHEFAAAAEQLRASHPAIAKLLQTFGVNDG